MTPYESLADLRPYLMRVALSRLRDSCVAEDVVQETLAAAMVASATFSGRSRLRTWVTGILLHKVADVFRAARTDPLSNPVPAGPVEDGDDFDATGAWRAPVTRWSDPECALQSKRCVESVAAQLAKLPERQSRAFVMREVMGLESSEICGALGITDSNLGVLLHRARLALRRSIDRDGLPALSA